MSRNVAVIATFVAGAIVGAQAPANASLAKHVGDVGAAVVSITISWVLIAVVLLAVGHPARLTGNLGSIKLEHALGGLGGAAVVTIGLIAVRPLGAGAVTALLVAGQLLVAVAADRYGWFGLHHVDIGVARALGLALVIGGTVLVTRT
jgi:bacterial/archaeal transporter family-2 protein